MKTRWGIHGELGTEVIFVLNTYKGLHPLLFMCLCMCLYYYVHERVHSPPVHILKGFKIQN